MACTTSASISSSPFFDTQNMEESYENKLQKHTTGI